MSAKDRPADLADRVEDLDFLAGVVSGIWGKKARAEALADMSGGDEAVAEALSAAHALGGVRALGAALAELRPDWRPRDERRLDGDRPR